MGAYIAPPGYVRRYLYWSLLFCDCAIARPSTTIGPRRFLYSLRRTRTLCGSFFNERACPTCTQLALMSKAANITIAAMATLRSGAFIGAPPSWWPRQESAVEWARSPDGGLRR